MKERLAVVENYLLSKFIGVKNNEHKLVPAILELKVDQVG